MGLRALSSMPHLILISHGNVSLEYSDLSPSVFDPGNSCFHCAKNMEIDPYTAL